MKEIGIYRKAFPRTSEAFIQEQTSQLVNYNPTFVSCTILNQTPFQTVSVNENDFLGVKQASYLLTRSANLFTNFDTLKKLALIHAHFGTDGVYAMELAEKLKIPLLVTFHGFDITIARSKMWRLRNLSYYQLLLHEAKLKQKAKAFIAVSGFIRQKLLENGYPEEKVIQHYIGVDTEKFFPAAKADERYILCVGRHTPKKGIDTLLRGWARIVKKYPDVSLIQVGTGSMSAEIQALATQLGINERVRFLGAQPYQVVQQLMSGAEVFALTSQTAPDGDSEGLPFVILEASACGVPIASTWHSGIPEAVLDGETGFLVSEKDDVALAEKLDILLGDRALSEKMGQKGRELVCEVFDIRKQTAKLEAIYDSLIH